MASYAFPQQRLSYSKKKANDFQWAKDVIDQIDKHRNMTTGGRNDIERKSIIITYLMEY